MASGKQWNEEAKFGSTATLVLAPNVGLSRGLTCVMDVPTKTQEEQMTQSFIHIESPNYLRAEDLPEPAGLGCPVRQRQSVALEIGCGIGDFIVQTAAETARAELHRHRFL